MYIKNVYCSKTGQSFVRSKLYVPNQSIIFHSWSAKMCLFKWDLIIIYSHYMVSKGNWRLIRNGSLGLRLATSLISTSKPCKDGGGFDPWLWLPDAIICWRTLEAIRFQNLDAILRFYDKDNAFFEGNWILHFSIQSYKSVCIFLKCCSRLEIVYLIYVKDGK